MKSISLDNVFLVVDNRAMKESIDKATSEIIREWQMGLEFEDNGYGDLSFTIKMNVLEKASQIDIRKRELSVKIINPKEKHGN